MKKQQHKLKRSSGKKMEKTSSENLNKTVNKPEIHIPINNFDKMSPTELMNSFTFESNKGFEHHQKTVKIDEEKSQVRILHSEENKSVLKATFDYNRISSEDLQYFLSVTAKLTANSSNPVIFNTSLAEETALRVLKEHNYNSEHALRALLFPAKNVLEPLELNSGKEKKFTNLFVNCACNELVGCNSKDKVKWIEHVSQCIQSKVKLIELKNLISIGEAMKISIPPFVREEINKSTAFAKEIKQAFTVKQSVETLCELHRQSLNFNVICEEFRQIEEIILKAKKWRIKVEEELSKTVWFKTLQNLFNEGKNLPVVLESFKFVETKYFQALEWYKRYDSVEKNQKTRVNNENTEKCSLPLMEEMISSARNINFCSAEVNLLTNSYTRLKREEERILMELNDPSCLVNYERVREFNSILSSIVFSTSLTDILTDVQTLYEWEEDLKVSLRYKNIKLSRLERLSEEARKLSRFEKSRKFVENVDLMRDWCERLNGVLYNESVEKPISVTELDELLSMQFEYTCEEFFFFREEAEKLQEIMSQLEKENLSDMECLSLTDKIKEITQNNNIKGEIIDKLKAKIEEAEQKKQMVVAVMKNEKNIEMFSELHTLEDRNNNLENIKLISGGRVEVQIEDLGSKEEDTQEVAEIKTFVEQSLKKESSFDWETAGMEDVLNILLEKGSELFSLEFHNKLFEVYSKLSLDYFFNLDKISLEDAEKLVIEHSEHSPKKVESLNLQIEMAKKWKKKVRKMRNNSEAIELNDIRNLIEEGSKLNLEVNELSMLVNLVNQYKEDDNLIKKTFSLGKQIEYATLLELKGIVNLNPFNSSSFKFVNALFKLVEAWKTQARAIINSRMLAELFFKEDFEGDNTEGKLLNKKRAAEKKKFDNILGIINNNKPQFISQESEKAVLNYNLDRIKPNFFKTLTFEKKIEIVSRVTELKEQKEATFCICRRSDDCVNYMIQCDSCFQWFHGICIGIKQNSSKKVEKFYCIVCCRRRYKTACADKIEVLKENRRVGSEIVVGLVRDGQQMPVVLSEMPVLEEELRKVQDWERRYIKQLEEMKETVENGTFESFSESEEVERKLIDLFLESEGFFIFEERAENLVLILNQIDWFRETAKLTEKGKKEKKKPKFLLAQYKYLFGSDMLLPNRVGEEEHRFYSSVKKIAAEIENSLTRENATLVLSFRNEAGEENLTINLS